MPPLRPQVERVADRVGQGDPRRATGQPGGAEAHSPFGRRLVPVDQQVEVELLRVLLPGPGRDMVRSQLDAICCPSPVRTFIRSDSFRMISQRSWRCQ